MTRLQVRVTEGRDCVTTFDPVRATQHGLVSRCLMLTCSGGSRPGVGEGAVK